MEATKSNTTPVQTSLTITQAEATLLATPAIQPVQSPLIGAQKSSLNNSINGTPLPNLIPFK